MMTPPWTKKLFASRSPSKGTNPLLLRRLRHGVLFFYALTLLIVLVAVGWLSWQDYRDTMQDAERQSMSLARSLDEHATRSLISVEQAMQNLVEDFERAGGMERMDEHWAHERLKSKVERTPQIRGIIAIDSNGILTAHGLEYPTRHVNLADRQYFPYLREHPETRLYIGDPVISRTDYKWLIPVTRRINNPDNSFGGVMLSGVEPDYFLKFYESLHLEKGTRIQMLRSDGILLLSYPLDITQLGNNVLDGNQDGFRIDQRGHSGLATNPQNRSFVAQISSLDLPIIIRVITDPERVLNKFRLDASIRITSSVLIIIVLTSMLGLLLGQIRNVEHSESQLQLTQFAVDESPDMVLWCDPQGRVRYANRQLSEVSGYDPGELLELGFSNLIGANDLRWEKLYTEMLECTRRTMENLLHKKNGSLVPIDLTLSLIADERHQYLCISARDITERHTAQIELRHHRDHLQELVDERTAEIRTMLDANPLAVVLSVEDHMQSVNPAFEAQFGYSMNSITGLPESLIHASAASYLTVRSAIQSRISLGSTYRGEAELRRSDGSLFWAMLFVRALQASAPERGVIFIIEDVSAQRAAAQALRQSEQLKRTILDTTADAFALIDEQRCFVDVNQSLCQQLGLTRQNMLGKTPESIWGEELSQQIFPADGNKDQISAQIEVSIPQPGQTQHPFLVSRGVIGGPRGRTEYVFAFLTDIAHQKDIERSLMLAKEAAETANHAKSIFLTNMSHELRTPMHAILSFSELGIQKAASTDTASVLRYFERIQNSGQHLLTLLNDLLDMSRMEADRMTYARSRHILQETVQVAVSETSSLLAAKDLTIAIDESQPPLAAIYDRVRITQVAINLLSNAIKYSPPGESIHLTYIYELSADRPGQHVVGFSIRDHGPGIPEEYLEQIFTSFEQGTSPNMDTSTGLGLSISRRILTDHDGSVFAENNPDGGATLTVRLPGEAADPNPSRDTGGDEKIS